MRLGEAFFNWKFEVARKACGWPTWSAKPFSFLFGGCYVRLRGEVVESVDVEQSEVGEFRLSEVKRAWTVHDDFGFLSTMELHFELEDGVIVRFGDLFQGLDRVLSQLEERGFDLENHFYEPGS